MLKEIGLPVRNTGTYIGHGVEAQFVANLGIACAALEHGKLFAPAGTGDVGIKSVRPFPGRSSPASATGAAKAWRWSNGSIEGERHGRGQHGDKLGRPIVAVTGIGVVTSLGVGKSDNWAKLTGGVSGIRRISRFPTEGLRTTIAGTVDDVYRDAMSPAELSERIALLAGEEAIAESGIGSKGRFPGPLLSRAAAARNRMGRSHQDGGDGGGQRRHRLSRADARRARIRRAPTAPSSSASSANISPSISAPKARRSRSTPPAPPAPAPSSSAWRRSGAANAKRRSRSAPTLR